MAKHLPFLSSLCLGLMILLPSSDDQALSPKTDCTWESLTLQLVSPQA